MEAGRAEALELLLVNVDAAVSRSGPWSLPVAEGNHADNDDSPLQYQQ